MPTSSKGSPFPDTSPKQAARPAEWAGDRHRLDEKAIPRAVLQADAVGLYLHVPFCVSKCRYCDFNSYAWTGQDLERHVDALHSEIRLRASGSLPQTVFFGGGTPSFLPAEQLARLLHVLHESTGFRDSAREVTLEANPESLDLATAQAALENGVDRLSIGVQSLRSDVLRAYDRVHSPEDAQRAFETARKAGFQRINVDLIFAFPGQQPSQWEEDLRTVLGWRPEHVSCYELSYEPGTSLTRLKDAGRWQAEDPDRCRTLFDRTRAICAEHGFGRYEVSNFARTGEASLHNLAYWRGIDYLGIGAGACSWRWGTRRSNLKLPEDYEQALCEGRDPVDFEERPDAPTRLFDYFLMALRLSREGASLQRARRLSGLDTLELHADCWRNWHERGWVEFFEHDEFGASLRASEEGLHFLDTMLQELLPSTPV